MFVGPPPSCYSLRQPIARLPLPCAPSRRVQMRYVLKIVPNDDRARDVLDSVPRARSVPPPSGRRLGPRAVRMLPMLQPLRGDATAVTDPYTPLTPPVTRPNGPRAAARSLEFALSSACRHPRRSEVAARRRAPPRPSRHAVEPRRLAGRLSPTGIGPYAEHGRRGYCGPRPSGGHGRRDGPCPGELAACSVPAVLRARALPILLPARLPAADMFPFAADMFLVPVNDLPLILWSN